MKLIQRQIGDVAVLELHGQLLGGPECQDIMARVDDLRNEGILKLVIDLRGIILLNSNGLGVLTAAQIGLQEAGGNVRLSRCSEKTERVLKGARVEDLFEMFDSVSSAVDSFAER